MHFCFSVHHCARISHCYENTVQRFWNCTAFVGFWQARFASWHSGCAVRLKLFSCQFVFAHCSRLTSCSLKPQCTTVMLSAGKGREAAGRCIADLVVDAASLNSLSAEHAGRAAPGQVAKHKLQYTFVKASSAPSASARSLADKDALTEKGFIEGDMVVLSIEGSRYSAH